MKSITCVEICALELVGTVSHRREYIRNRSAVGGANLGRPTEDTSYVPVAITIGAVQALSDVASGDPARGMPRLAKLFAVWPMPYK